MTAHIHNPGVLRLPPGGGAAGLTLVEVMVSMAIIALAVGTSILSLTQLNKAAQSSRLYTGAQAVAQNHLDDALVASWNSQSNAPPRAPVALGTHYVYPDTTDSDGDGLPGYYDPNTPDPYTYSNTAPNSPNVPIYEEDPVNNTGITIMGTVRVVSADVGGLDYNLRRIDSIVTYTHDGRTRTVQLTTFRTSD